MDISRKQGLEVLKVLSEEWSGCHSQALGVPHMEELSGQFRH